MITYKHTQISYFMIIVALAVLVFFAYLQVMARAEPPSVNSGTNFAMTAIMALILFVLASFTTLTVSIDETSLRLKFGWGIFKKKFALADIVSTKLVKNPWYYGWGIRVWFWPHMWIYNIAGSAAVEINLKNGRIYRIGTDEPEELEHVLKTKISMISI